MCSLSNCAYVTIVYTVQYSCRYISRCLLLEFEGKEHNSVLGFSRLHELMVTASAAIGEVIEIGSRFFTEGMMQLDESILPELRTKLPGEVLPRVIPAYGTLLWFTKEVGH